MIDAIIARKQGRDPVQRVGYRGWIVEIYRVGRRHQYQALAAINGVPALQTARIGGPGAREAAGLRALMLVDHEIERRKNLVLQGDPVR